MLLLFSIISPWWNQFHSLKITFKSSKKIRTTHFNISFSVNVVEVMKFATLRLFLPAIISANKVSCSSITAIIKEPKIFSRLFLNMKCNLMFCYRTQFSGVALILSCIFAKALPHFLPFQSLTICAKSPILDLWKGSVYLSS